MNLDNLYRENRERNLRIDNERATQLDAFIAASSITSPDMYDARTAYEALTNQPNHVSPDDADDVADFEELYDLHHTYAAIFDEDEAIAWTRRNRDRLELDDTIDDDTVRLIFRWAAQSDEPGIVLEGRNQLEQFSEALQNFDDMEETVGSTRETSLAIFDGYASRDDDFVLNWLNSGEDPDLDEDFEPVIPGVDVAGAMRAWRDFVVTCLPLGYRMDENSLIRSTYALEPNWEKVEEKAYDDGELNQVCGRFM